MMTHDAPIVEADFTALLDLLERDTMREIIAMFVDACPARLAAVRDGLASGDLKAVATAYHTMRSGCGQLGARELEALCAQAEKAAKSGAPSDARALLGGVEAELARVLDWFRTHDWMPA